MISLKDLSNKTGVMEKTLKSRLQARNMINESDDIPDEVLSIIEEENRLAQISDLAGEIGNEHGNVCNPYLIIERAKSYLRLYYPDLVISELTLITGRHNSPRIALGHEDEVRTAALIIESSYVDITNDGLVSLQRYSLTSGYSLSQIHKRICGRYLHISPDHPALVDVDEMDDLMTSVPYPYGMKIKLKDKDTVLGIAEKYCLKDVLMEKKILLVPSSRLKDLESDVEYELKDKIYSEPTHTIYTVSRDYQIPILALKRDIELGLIESLNDKISRETVDRIIAQRDRYISDRELFEPFRSNLFKPERLTEVEKAENWIDEQPWSGDLEYLLPDEILYEVPSKTLRYYERSEMSHIRKELVDFFCFFRSTPDETAASLEKVYPRHKGTIAAFHDYRMMQPLTPSSCEAYIKLLKHPKDILDMSAEEISGIWKALPTVEAGKCLVTVYNLSLRKRGIHDSELRLMPSEQGPGESAYPFDLLCRLATLVFNADRVRDLTKLALSSVQNAVLWRNTSMLFLTAVRGTDYSKWEIPTEEDLTAVGINVDKIPHLLLSGSIPDKTLLSLSRQSVKRFELEQYYPHKTAASTPFQTLHISLSTSMHVHMGRIILILTYHQYMDPEQYRSMNTNLGARVSIGKLSAFFGDEMRKIVPEGIVIHRMNKSAMQMMESAGKASGYESMTLTGIAQYARSHTSPESTLHYTSDGNLAGVTPQDVLTFAFDRGFMGSLPYRLIKSSFPELSTNAEVITKIVTSLPVTTFEMEQNAFQMQAMDLIIDSFRQIGQIKSIPVAIYKASLGIGMAKDVGCYCLYRALGFVCPYPERKSCILSGCHMDLLTHEAMPRLMEVLGEVKSKALNSADPMMKEKNKRYLRELLLRYQDILIALQDEMTPEEWQVFVQSTLNQKGLIDEAVH